MNLSISYDFNLDIAAAQAGPTALSEQFTLDAVKLHPLGDDHHLVFNTQTLKRCIVRGNVLPLLGLCDRFRTLAEHRDAAIEQRAGQQGPTGAEILAVLEHLRNNGILVDAEQWLARVSPETADGPESSDWALVIATCDRPVLLQRLLDSAVPYITDSVRPSQALLLDDSRQSANRAANRRAWSDWLERCGLSGDYLDRDGRARLSQSLAREFPAQAETLVWMLSPEGLPDDRSTIGQVRNLALLLTAGRPLLSLDDDCILEPCRHRSCEQRLTVGPLPTEALPYADRAALETAVRSLDLNPFAEHLRMLGAPPRRAFERLGFDWHDVAWLRGMDPDTLRRWSGGSRVRFTVNATCGDPGTPSMHWLYSQPLAAAARAAEHLERCPAEQDIERLFWKGQRGVALSFDEALMTTTLTGIDNRVLVPAVLPFGRGEDLVLGAGLYALHPSAMQCAFNWALPHRPEPARYWRRPAAGTTRWSPEPDWSAGQLIARAGIELTVPRNPAVRMVCLAEYCQELADASRAELASRLESLRLGYRSSYLKGYLDNRAGVGLPGGHWQQDLSVLIEQANSELMQPLDPSDQHLSDCAALLARHAAALRLWPELRQRMIGQRAETGP